MKPNTLEPEVTVDAPNSVPPASTEATGLLSHLKSDFPASLVVFLVALPLSLGIAMASGAPMMAGLIAAIVGGIVVGMVGGAPLQVSGPAAGLTVIVIGLVQQFGWQATCAITVGAGILQIVLGAAGVAPLALGISPAVIHGMLAAIGILIAASQMHVVLGFDPGGKGLKSILKLPEHIAHLDLAPTMIGVIAIVVLVAWPYLPFKKLRALPSALAAVMLATVVSLVFNMHLPRVELGGSLFSSLALPMMPSADLGSVITAVLTLCFVASAESLLCAVATDKLHSGPRANLHKELIGQGVGNTLSGLLGGLPVTGVIVRSTANITAGARTRLSAVLHGVWMLLCVTLLPDLITKVPLAALAGLLVYTGVKLVNLKHIRDLTHHGEVGIYAVTVAAIVATNLLTGLAIGFGLAILRMLWNLTHVDIHVEQAGDRWTVFVDGTLTFAGVPKLVTRLSTIPTNQHVTVDLNVRFIDHAGLEALSAWAANYEKAGGTVDMAHLAEAWERSRRRKTTRTKAKTGA